MEKKAHRGMENLVSFKDRTTEETRKIGRIGGIQSGKVRRANANARASMKMILNLPLTSKEKKFISENGG